MNVLFDTDVLIDFLLDRKPFADPAAMLLSAAEGGAVNGFACANSITTIHYLASKAVGKRQARRHVESLLTILDIAPVGRAVLENALKAQFTDFEDSVVAHSAAQAAIDVIVTRNQKDFKHSPVTAQSPLELLAFIESQGAE